VLSLIVVLPVSGSSLWTLGVTGKSNGSRYSLPLVTVMASSWVWDLARDRMPALAQME
jgi:hypothetical protein